MSPSSGQSAVCRHGRPGAGSRGVRGEGRLLGLGHGEAGQRLGVLQWGHRLGVPGPSLQLLYVSVELSLLHQCLTLAIL